MFLIEGGGPSFYFRSSFIIISKIYSITHDAPGNIVNEYVSVPGLTTLSGEITNTFDSLDQIATSVSTRTATGMGYSWTPAADGFQADAAGNLTTLRDQTQPYTSSNNEINKTGFAYDSNGNPTTYETHTVTWDPENRMTEYAGSTTLTCGWRPDGMRAWKSSSSTTTYFYYDQLGVPVLEYQGGSLYKVNTFGPNGLISTGTSSSNEIYYQFDERGDTVSRSNSSGTVLGYHGSDTYGVQYASESSTDPFLGFGAQWGYYRDSEIAFLLLGHRIYDPGYARFLNRDPIGYSGGINPYSYGSNSPTGTVDPSGLDGLTIGGFQFTWAGVGHGLMTGLAAVGSAFTLGRRWDGQRSMYQDEPGFATSEALGSVGRDALLTAAGLEGLSWAAETGRLGQLGVRAIQWWGQGAAAYQSIKYEFGQSSLTRSGYEQMSQCVDVDDPMAKADYLASNPWFFVKNWRPSMAALRAGPTADGRAGANVTFAGLFLWREWDVYGPTIIEGK